MIFLNVSSARAARFSALPLLALFGHTLGACSEDEPRPDGPLSTTGGDAGDGDFAGNGGDGDGDGDSSTGGVNGDGDGDTSSGGMAMGGSGGGMMPLPGSPCEDMECPTLALCDDSGDEPVCVCPEGFEGEDCSDVNECTTLDACPVGTVCENTYGAFLCRCPAGQTTTGDGCTDVLECDQNPCDDNAACTEGENTFTCSCNSGFTGNGHYCSDIDSCAANPCGENGTCINTASGYACQCDPGYSTASDCASATCETLTFADAALEAAVRDTINKPSGDITQTDIQGTTNLYLANADIHDLSGLECWNHLQILDLNDTPVGEMPGTFPNALDALGDLNQLRELYLNCTGISSLDVLADHPTLTRLGLARYQSCQSSTVDLSAVGSMTSLRWLDVSGLEVSSLEPVTSLSALEYLAASNNEIVDLALVSGLQNLKFLDLAGNQISDAAPLSGLSLLEELDISGNALTTIAPLTGLASLRVLSVADNQLTTLPSLTGLESLTFFDALGNQISSLDAIADLGTMSWIGMGDNEIETLAPLVGGSARGTLSLRGNPLDCSAEEDNFSIVMSQGLEIRSDCD